MSPLKIGGGRGVNPDFGKIETKGKIWYKIERGGRGGQAISYEYKIANLPKLLISSLRKSFEIVCLTMYRERMNSSRKTYQLQVKDYPKIILVNQILVSHFEMNFSFRLK